MRRRQPRHASAAGPIAAILLVTITLILMIGNFLVPQAASELRMMVVDALTPVLEVFWKPAAMIQKLPENVNDLAHLREENQELQKQITDLKITAQAALQLDAENKSLKALLKYKDEAVLSYLTARVIGENTGSFSNSVIITAGRGDGVEKDMVALDDNGVIGRVVEVGEWSSRILLLSDLNFRLPVMVEEARQRGIFTGQSREDPKLIYVSQPAEVKPGMRVVTSGHGGIFPAGLAVGVVKEVKDHDVIVGVYGHLDRLELVRLARYKLGGPDGIKPVEVMSPAVAPQQAPSPAPQQTQQQTPKPKAP
jgi:rod shape-determining protein MreC